MRTKVIGSLLVLAICVGVAPAVSETVIPVVSSSQKLGQKPGKFDQNNLFDLLTSATNESRGREIENEIWRNWMVAPNDQIQELLKQALEARRWYDFEKARKLLNQIVEQAPEYAEGWNQRAFILFLQEKFDDALSDAEKALELEPRHFGAMAGQAQILMRQGRFSTAQKILKKAVKIHPYLRERSMIIKTQEQDL